ncbi:FecR domain-containing protein [Sphingobacterium sp.]|uniref:FecR family protein n=1 Tax=Sphingobacterium sp. TaxID=341027 RepID=UPI0028AE56E1|nr:FecR domain-containing protein [Sphingobacterium sp.]
MNQIEQYSQLIRKYLADQASKEEQELLQGLLDDPVFLQAWENVWRENSYPVQPATYPDPHRMMGNIWTDPRIAQPATIQQTTTDGHFNFRRRWWQVAAVFLAFFGAALWGYHNYYEVDTQPKELLSKVSIVPGSDKAMIILENGKEIDLSLLRADTVLDQGEYLITKDNKGQISYRLKDNLSPTKNIVYNTVVTPRGGEYTLKMADGSLVQLNAGSKIKYPVKFDAKLRSVQLEGEAYFEVAKMDVKGKRVPFIVQSGAQTLEVLGTHFNIKSFGDRIVTTLVEGKVRLSYADAALKEQVLAPNDQVVFDKSRTRVKKEQVDPFYSLAWKNGNFAFDNASIQTVMDEVARWYDVEVSYQDQLQGQHFSGTISRYENIDKLLKTIAFAGGVHFERKGRRIYVLN